MSRIAIHPIEIPENTDISVEDGLVRVSGPKGEIKKKIHPSVSVEKTDEGVKVAPTNDSREARALWGTYASHIKNMITGVNEGYQKKLVFKGIGYQAHVSGGTLEMELGFSHSVTLDIPEGLEVSVEKSEIAVSGIDKEKVGQFAAEIRRTKEPEPYKGKGIRYSDEVIRRKEGKKTV